MFKEWVQHWNTSVFGNIFRRKKRCLARLNLKGIQERLGRRPSRFLEELERQLISEYNDILEQEEIFWFKRSRVKWLLEGERNTRYFHTTGRRAKGNRF